MAVAQRGVAAQWRRADGARLAVRVGCLAKLRDGTADAFQSDAVILLGIHAQSPVMAFRDRAAMSGLCRAIDRPWVLHRLNRRLSPVSR